MLVGVAGDFSGIGQKQIVGLEWLESESLILGNSSKSKDEIVLDRTGVCISETDRFLDDC